MKKITIFVVVVLLLAVTAVPAFAHPDVSADGLANAPTNPNSALLDSGADPSGVDLLALNVSRVPVCGGHSD